MPLFSAEVHLILDIFAPSWSHLTPARPMHPVITVIHIYNLILKIFAGFRLSVKRIEEARVTRALKWILAW